MTKLNSEVLYDPNCPCSGCPSEVDCIRDKQACRDFLHYVNSGKRQHKYRQASVPLYRRLFPLDADVA
ncbi:hypothetical protein [Acidithiobacillus sp.]|uniref:hypothetical protein n=1 Tax=Acidithiobacillus sp. TaxID=1872118 RepID=UPI003CFF75DD